MRLDQSVEALLRWVAGLDRGACMRELHRVPYLTLDFTDEYLDSLPLEQLRHVLLAAVLQARRHTREAG